MKFSHICLLIYLAVFAVCAINPYDRSVWWAENIPIIIIVAFVAVMARKFEFSKTALVFMLILPVLHTIGGHFTFERVPFGFISDLFGFERNHYDRIAHFSVGFYAYPIAEYILKKQLTCPRWILYLFPIFTIVTVAASYEIFEWWYAISADPEAGIAVLGSQGDIWDAQKDMLADTLGSIFAMGVFWIKNRK